MRYHQSSARPGGQLPNGPQTAILRTDKSRTSGTGLSELKASQRQVSLVLRRTDPMKALGPETPRPAATDLIEVPSSAKAGIWTPRLLGLLLGAGLAMMLDGFVGN